MRIMGASQVAHLSSQHHFKFDQKVKSLMTILDLTNGQMISCEHVISCFFVHPTIVYIKHGLGTALGIAQMEHPSTQQMRFVMAIII